MTYTTTLWRCLYRTEYYGQLHEPCNWSVYADERPEGCPNHRGKMAEFGEFELGGEG